MRNGPEQVRTCLRRRQGREGWGPGEGLRLWRGEQLSGVITLAAASSLPAGVGAESAGRSAEAEGPKPWITL